MKEYQKSTIDFYDEHVEEFYKHTIDLQSKYFMNKFITLLPKGSLVLDVGCGFGRDCKTLADNGFDVYGIDLSKNMIKKAKSFDSRCHFYVRDMMNPEFEDNLFEGIWCTCALLHLNKQDARIALKEFNRVLKKEGIVYLGLKEGDTEGLIKDPRYNGAEKYYTHYRESEFIELLKNAGFEIVHSHLKYNEDVRYLQIKGLNIIAKKINSLT